MEYVDPPEVPEVNSRTDVADLGAVRTGCPREIGEQPCLNEQQSCKNDLADTAFLGCETILL